ncbi:hypothetical protein [[Limnothrix rosea] IAM M-220]|uniref:hypothetical protein n=1 Tax=[Limnothrix rosea] IAM M-220 TaxID=454133 RepID=UPI000968EB29|nr:hypothetical protein [[Limnothrix rosea] IAM M-220]OKH14161.1 hypothetical protein NIES208_14365 [[Limnothrix rosea] IAM M-220]
MTFPPQDEDYSVLWMDQGVPKKIGTLPRDIDAEEIPQLLNFLETIHNLGVEKGKRIGKKEIFNYLQQQCQSLENADQ